MSKGVRRYGEDGSRLDSTYGSTGGHVAHESEIAPSIPARHVGYIGPARTEVVGHAPDDSGKWLKPTFDGELIGNAVQTHEPLKPQGMTHSASGGKFGKPTQRPAAASNTGTRRMDHGALAGDPGSRTRYSGGKGPVR
jgi:hypothetical protein